LHGREVHNWLQRAEVAARAARACREANSGPLRQLRCVIDAANVAIMRGSKNPRAWTEFYLVAGQSRQSDTNRQEI
jgi:hypothetical protein